MIQSKALPFIKYCKEDTNFIYLMFAMNLPMIFNPITGDRNIPLLLNETPLLNNAAAAHLLLPSNEYLIPLKVRKQKIDSVYKT